MPDKVALISVSDKRGIEEFVKFLISKGFRIIATSSTARFLREKGLDVEDVSSFTGFPEILGGRVKTLHPKIHAGILARRDKKEDMAVLESEGFPPIDMVICNLYPFEDIIKQDNPVMEEVIENIDIGGPTLVRAAAKNFEHVTVIVNPDRYKDVIEELRSKGEVSLEKKRELAVEAFEHIARYDAIIANYLRERLTKNKFPENLVIPLEKVQPTRYGENPHQEASFYRILPYGGGITNVEQLQGKQLSYNNILDAEAALDCLREFSEPTAVIVKHTSPCGIASATNIMDAWKRAFETDPISPFGGIVAFNREVEEKLAEELTKHFLEIVIAPHFGKEALNVFKKKKNLRLLQVRDIYSGRGNFVYRSVNGGMLVQDKDTGEIDTSNWKVVTRKKPNKEDIESMIFAVKCVKHVKSNAVVFVKESKTVAIGGGQTSRIDAVRVAVDKGGERIRDSIMASDGFFPFRDAIDVAADAGVRAIVQPGGSIRDKEIIEAADERGICMVFTGQRYFRH